MRVREQIEGLEKANLSSFASLACASTGRETEEPPDPVRTCYQRDRDRILHSKPFRRLMHKTQVFISPSGDHYRTRLTHTLEVAQIARTISRALRLNEDLTEAIALGHDVGHTPFGHAGESALDDALKEHNATFRHYEQSVRVLSKLEKLNLTNETLEGIGGHSKGRKDLTAFDGDTSPSLEAAVVRVADRIAYLNHDLDDALRAEWLSETDLPSAVHEIGSSHSDRIGAMVEDIVTESLDKPTVGFSISMLERVNTMKEFLFDNLYLEYPRRFPDIEKAQHTVRALFDHFLKNQHLMPSEYTDVQGVVDYVSGMTDRFAVRAYNEIFVPADWT